ncbi:MAG: 3-hydroxyacyl-CoA dehydrogenase family protein [Ardenticatenales bacterium]
MRLTILGEADTEWADALAETFRAAGHDVVAGDVGADHRPSDARLADALAASDAAIDVCVVDRVRKGAALALCDAHLPPDRPLWSCCLATAATYVAASVETPERVFGFSLLPPWENRTTVECARALQSDAALQRDAQAVWEAIGREAVWVGDGTGLVLGRIVACLANEAAFALMEGAASGADIDTAMRLGTRYPLGPLEWANRIGPRVIVAILDALAAEHGEDRYRVAPLLRHMAVAGRPLPIE